ncbi:MAG: TatD family hydrolase [bacterium]|nr:TatD family hydrolase [bacterium]
MLFDSHTHVNFQPFSENYKEVIQRALDNDVLINNVGSQWESSVRSVEIAEEFNYGVWASIGVHPIHLFSDVTEEQEIEGTVQKIRTRAEVFDYEKYKKLAQSSDKVIAIGECGLDYYHFMRSGLEDKRVQLIKQQLETLSQHFDLAIELDLPVVIHCRDAATHDENSIQAFEDLLSLLQNYNGKVKGVIHCYTGIPKYIPAFLDLGLYIGFTGIVTFPNSIAVQQSLELVPIDRVLIETDAPYLTPVPFRGKRNEPLYVKHVAEKIAEIKQISLTEVSEKTTANAFELFKLS